MSSASRRPAARRLSARLLAPLAALSLAAPGCIHVSAGFEEGPDRFEIDGPGVIYATADAWPRWNGNLLELGLFNQSERDGELVSLDLWPLFGVGVGVVGARVRVLMFEFGAATLFHDPLPLPARYGWDEPAAPAGESAPAPNETERVDAD